MANHSHHDHGCHNGHHHHHVTDNIKIAFFLNFTFTIIEIIGSIFTNSTAILADVVHDLGDTFALGFALFFESFSRKKRDQNFSYGYRRFSTLSAFLNSIILIFGSLFAIYYSIDRIVNPQAINVEWMFVFSILGVLFNGMGVLRLKKSDTSSQNQKVVMLHLLEDAMGWLAIFIGCFFIYFLNWIIIDPLLSFFIALFILWNAFRSLKSISLIFLQAIPDNDLEEKIKTKLLESSHIKSIHDLHFWSLDGNYNVLTIHLVVSSSNLKKEDLFSIKSNTRKILKKLGIQHSTIEIETENEDCELCFC